MFVVKAIGWLVFAVTVFLIVDALTRLLLNGRTRLDLRISIKSNSRVLFVYYPGILADGDKSSLKLQDVWRRYGDVLLVSYDGRRFVPAATTRKVAEYIAMHSDEYDTVVFLGSSMGGLLSYDTYQRVKHIGGVKFMIVAMDSPTKRSDFQAPLSWMSMIMYVWWAGMLSNLLLSKLYFSLTFRAPKERNIEQDVDRNELRQRVKEAKSSQLSWQNDEIRYIMLHGGLEAGSLDSILIVYVRSTRDDDTVRPSAAMSWFRAAHPQNKCEVFANSTHVGFNECPSEWQRVFVIEIMPKLGLQA